MKQLLSTFIAILLWLWSPGIAIAGAPGIPNPPIPDSNLYGPSITFIKPLNNKLGKLPGSWICGASYPGPQPTSVGLWAYSDNTVLQCGDVHEDFPTVNNPIWSGAVDMSDADYNYQPMAPVGFNCVVATRTGKLTYSDLDFTVKGGSPVNCHFDNNAFGSPIFQSPPVPNDGTEYTAFFFEPTGKKAGGFINGFLCDPTYKQPSYPLIAAKWSGRSIACQTVDLSNQPPEVVTAANQNTDHYIALSRPPLKAPIQPHIDVGVCLPGTEPMANNGVLGKMIGSDSPAEPYVNATCYTANIHKSNA